MKTIKFGSASYNLVDDINVHGTRLQATIYKAANTVEQIAENTTGVAEIKVFDENDSLLGVYDGYTERVAISLYKVGDADVVSVELEHADTASKVAELVDAVDTQAAAITDVASEIASLADSQTVQDEAINDLAEAVGGLEPTV